MLEFLRDLLLLYLRAVTTVPVIHAMETPMAEIRSHEQSVDGNKEYNEEDCRNLCNDFQGTVPGKTAEYITDDEYHAGCKKYPDNNNGYHDF